MTQIDFYILQDAGGTQLQRFACRLVDKAWQRGLRCHINTATPEQAERIDDLLWTFRDISFLPHAKGITNSEDSQRLAAVIGTGTEPAGELNVLINLSPEVPAFFSRFERVAELVDNDESRRTAGRERFRFYRDRGYPLESHNIR
ncbi:MAG: DNA polymerase III subunit chi [Gammaproteobacteria bacterium]|nr:DNA polymerase III subunit chi [Gammaproteobacteria bacterium]MDH3768747.1 DNA polymerase III subunit chi [Gammaproteobacteria bacterium]